MNPASVRPARAAVLLTLAAPAALLAQTRFDNTAIPLEFLETSPWTVTAGTRVAPQGATVNFSELGQIPSIRSAPPAGEGAVDRFYDDGAVRKDAARGLGSPAMEVDAAGNVFSGGSERYQARSVDAAGNEVFFGDFLSYNAERSRIWTATNASQFSNGQVAMHLYSAESAGGTAVSDSEMSAGFEVGVSRRLRRLGRRAEFGVSGLFAMSDIDAGAKGSVNADLVAITDHYNLYGPTPTKFPYTGPNFDNWTAPDGTVITNGRETTTPIGQIPFNRQLVHTPNGAVVNGAWKINGAYLLVRVGPNVRVFLTDRLAISFEAGLAAAFVGTDYEVEETMTVEGIATPISITEEEETTEVLTGFYGAGAVEYWVTDRTNAYAGAAYESLDTYQQSVGGRTAEIDVGSTTTVRLGLTTRF